MKKKNYVKSYRELCKSSIMLYLVMVALHLMAALVLHYVWGSGAVGKGIACEIFLHLSYITLIRFYSENYKHLVKTQIIEKSKKLFWYGMLPFIVSELINIAVLVLISFI